MSGILEATSPDAAAVALQDTLAATLAPVSAAVWGAIQAQAGLREAAGLLPTMQAAVGIIIACEALQGMAKAAETAARIALAEAMSLGATTIQAGLHTASLRDAPRSAVVTDLALLPPAMMTTPAPKPDLTAIRKALLDGPVPGAILSNGFTATVQIRSNSK